MTAATIERIPLSDLVMTWEFQRLTPQQQIWVRAYLGSGETAGTFDAFAATRIAYPAAAMQNLAARSCQIQSHAKVRHLLNIYFGHPELNEVSPPDRFFKQLKTAIRKSIREDGKLTVATTKAIELYRQCTGEPFEKRKRKAAPEAPKQVIEIPADALGEFKSDAGVIVGYRDAAGKDVYFAR